LLASLLLFAFYLKISYALVGIAFVGVLFFDSSYNRRLSLATFVVFTGAIGLIEAMYGFNGDYIGDIAATLRSRGANRGTMIPKFFANIREFLLTAFAVVMALKYAPKRFHFLAYVGFVALACLAIIDQNSHSRGAIALLAVCTVSQELIRRHIYSQNKSADLRIEAMKSLACLAIVCALVIQPIIYSWTAATIIRSTVSNPKYEMPGGLKGMVFSSYDKQKDALAGSSDTETQAGDNASSQRITYDYLTSVIEGVSLLESIPATGKSVIVLDFVNPFSFVVGLPPAVGDSTCLHYGQTVNKNVYPKPEEYLAHTDFVMVPKTHRVPQTSKFLWEMFGPFVKERFVQESSNEYWDVWRRK
jgi:hypothetical protein